MAMAKTMTVTAKQTVMIQIAGLVSRVKLKMPVVIQAKQESVAPVRRLAPVVLMVSGHPTVAVLQI